MNTLRALLVLPLLLASSLAAAQPATPRQTTADDRRQLDITITNNGLALVKDRRIVAMSAGPVDLAWRDVSAQIRPETALLGSVDAPGSVRIVEQNFEQTLLSPQSLLEKHVGKTVGVIRTNPATGAETLEKAEVLSARDGVILKIGDRIETGTPGRLAFDSIPAGLHDRPTLSVSLDNRGPARQELELDYLTNGMTWKADYVAKLNAAGDRADLSGWFTIVNSTGTAFRNARLQLIAGDINQARKAMPLAAARADVNYAPAPESVSREAFSEYHLYTVNRPVTLAENQTKQIALLSADSVPVTRSWLLKSGDYAYRNVQTTVLKQKAGAFIEFENVRENRLGMPLPLGIVRVYAKDTTGSMQLAGEDSIKHTPVGEKVRVKLGDAFDVTAQRRQTHFVRVSGDGKNEYAFESGHEIVLKNAKKEAVTVKVQETLPGDWRMLAESHPHEKTSSNTAVWHVRVPAQGQATLTWRVQAKY